MTQEGVIKNEIEANKTLFTLRLPAQPHVRQTLFSAKATEVQIVAFTENNHASEGLRNALNLLEVLYRRGVTDPYVLRVLLEATGHPETPNLEDSKASSPSPISENEHDPR